MITVEQHVSDLEKYMWSFVVFTSHTDTVQLRLANYARLTRPTKRHKFVRDDYFNNYDRRVSTIKEDAVPLPEWVIADAKKQVVIEVKK